MNSKCFLCGSEHYKIVHNGVRGNSNINVLKCSDCGLVRLSEFIDNSDEYYKNSGMRDDEVESNLKEIRTTALADDHRRFEFISRMIENKNYLDFGCGAGGVLLQARDVAKSVYGIELEKTMVTALNQDGIKCYSSIEEASEGLQGKIDVVSLFHVMEHLEDPFYYLEKLGMLLSDEGIMIIEIPNADDALLSLYNNDDFADFTYWESHLYLYNNNTFTSLMNKAGLKIRFLGQIQRYPLSNALYWLSKGKPGGHKEWSMLSNERLDVEYENTLAKLGIADTIIAVVEK